MEKAIDHVSRKTGCGPGDARMAIERCGGSVDQAVVAIDFASMCGVSVAKALKVAYILTEGGEVDDGTSTLKVLQSEVAEWSQRNFGDVETWQPLMGAGEELGELFHAHLKAAQGIRGTAEEHAEAAKDAIGDIVIYLADYCRRSGYDFHDCVWFTWSQVSKRDRVTHPADADKQVG